MLNIIVSLPRLPLGSRLALAAAKRQAAVASSRPAVAKRIVNQQSQLKTDLHACGTHLVFIYLFLTLADGKTVKVGCISRFPVDSILFLGANICMRYTGKYTLPCSRCMYRCWLPYFTGLAYYQEVCTCTNRRSILENFMSFL